LLAISNYSDFGPHRRRNQESKERSHVRVRNYATTTRCRETALVYRSRLYAARNRHGRDRHINWWTTRSWSKRHCSTTKFGSAYPLDSKSWLRVGVCAARNEDRDQLTGCRYRRWPRANQTRRRHHRCRSWEIERQSHRSSRKILSVWPERSGRTTTQEWRFGLFASWHIAIPCDCPPARP